MNLIDTVFKITANLFDKFTPKALHGIRTVIGFVGLATVAGLQMKNLIDQDLATKLNIGFAAWTSLALNAKDNTGK